MDPGKFIVLEGIDGSGTSTQAKLLASYLFERDKKNIVTLTREPTKLSPEGLELRRRLEGKLLPGEEVINAPEYWTDLFIHDRQWHLDHIVVPAVLSGQQVVSDRHKLSTIAYQSVQGMDLDELIQRHQQMYPTDLTLILTVPLKIAQERAQREGRSQEYFDRLDFQQSVQENYLLAAQKWSESRHHYLDREERIEIIDGSGTMDEVAKVIQSKVDILFG
jgi:dTMP kinase